MKLPSLCRTFGSLLLRRRPRVALHGRRLLSGQLSTPLENLDRALLERYVDIVDATRDPDYVICLNALLDKFPLRRTLLLLREPPHSIFLALYEQRAACHTVITYSPAGRNEFAFARCPVVFPYVPQSRHLTRSSLKMARRGVYMAGRGGRETYGNFFGGLALTRARNELGCYLLKHYTSTHLYGKGWPPGARDTSGPGYSDRKLIEIEEAQADFIFCIENVMCPNYISEKIHDGFQSDRLVLYLGEPDITRWVPENCFIDLRRYFNFQSQLLDTSRVISLLESISQEDYESILLDARAWHRDLYRQVESATKELTCLLLRRMGVKVADECLRQ